MSGRDRNAPCPCGSGKKYKKCCLDSVGGGTIRFTLEERAGARRFLERVLHDAEDASALARVADDLMWRGLAGLGDLPDFVQNVGLEWRLDWLGRQRGAAGLSLAGELSADSELALKPGERAYLRALDTLPVRMYEVGQVHPGSGMTLWDATTDQSLRVFSPTVAQGVQTGWFIAGRVLPVGPSGRAELDQPALVFPTEAEPLIDAFLDDVRGAATEQGVALHADEGFRRLSITLFVPWARGTMKLQRDALGGPVATPPGSRPGLKPVGLTTTDGEPMVPTRVLFDVVDAAALGAALADEPTFSRDADTDSWAWLRPDPRDPGVTVSIGKLTLEGAVLALECLSDARAARGRALVEDRAGGAVAHRETQTRSIQELLAETPAGSAPGSTLEAAVADAVRARLQAVFRPPDR